MNANYIAGEWMGANGSVENINPSDCSDMIGEYAQASTEQTSIAVHAASQALGAWRETGPQARADMLERIGAELAARREELGTLLSREEGKTLAEGIGEVARAAAIFKFYAGEVFRIRGERMDSVRPGLAVEVTREPVGVIGIITPWNFPMAIPAWKIAPALAYGNCVIFKPAELVPGSAWALAEIISRAGLPAGVFNLVMGKGSVVGQAMLENPDVAAISFTGSEKVGRHVIATATARMAKVQVEMGGKNPLVVLDDAELDAAVDCALQGAFHSTGQRCTASSRLIVERGIHSRFVSRLVQRTQALRVGHALHAQTQIGPVVDASQLGQDLAYIQIGKDAGARLLCGGERLPLRHDGFYLQPALFADVVPEMRIAREEIFGPVACVLVADSYEHALALANDTPYGLSSGICTQSLKHATDFKRRAQAGMVMVNTPTAGVDYHVPFGGRKGSSYGSREQGSHAAEFFTTVKTSYTAS
ncbi:aldehyde dehydrogenase family protein [Cupriavidus basilensis]|uniref:Aldehyde dehydrogenase family protein n=1 Tax=Cupriavidus basilensis TaxID=68895 RepID=A0ABT6AML1_9BURK|nr:aldehyde dehydrogenase family protein [Cupriavidus basilensis]MDF3833807.1 aldehyde dehydrogenase family protein [Cupriavidus basilensis]